MEEDLVRLLIDLCKSHPYGVLIAFALFLVLKFGNTLNGLIAGPPKTLAGKALDRASTNVRKDAVGTLKLPGRASRFVRIAPEKESKPGFIRPGFMLVLATAYLVLISMHACSPSAIENQATIAHNSARLANAAEPLVMQEYERLGRVALDRACCDREAMHSALEAHKRQWEPVVLAWEASALAHGAWRRQVEDCRRAPDERCEASAIELGLEAARTLLTARCSLRRLGREDLDPIPGPALCPSGDGGVS